MTTEQMVKWGKKKRKIKAL